MIFLSIEMQFIQKITNHLFLVHVLQCAALLPGNSGKTPDVSFPYESSNNNSLCIWRKIEVFYSLLECTTSELDMPEIQAHMYLTFYSRFFPVDP